MQNNQSIMQISENKDGSAKVLFRIRKAEMTDVDEIMAVMHEAKNDKEHPDLPVHLHLIRRFPSWTYLPY